MADSHYAAVACPEIYFFAFGVVIVPIVLKMVLWDFGANFNGEYRDSGRRRLALMLSNTLHIISTRYHSTWRATQLSYGCMEELHILPVGIDELDCLATNLDNLFLKLGCSKTTACSSSFVYRAENHMCDCPSAQGDGVCGAVCGEYLLQLVI